MTSNGVVMERRGAGWDDGRRCSQKKLCFVATDQGLLSRVLGELADRSDCHYVKYSIEPRDGMYLCRCFLLDDQIVGALWREYKKHPRMMATFRMTSLRVRSGNRNLPPGVIERTTRCNRAKAGRRQTPRSVKACDLPTAIVLWDFDRAQSMAPTRIALPEHFAPLRGGL
jgi:hypothetical protein